MGAGRPKGASFGFSAEICTLKRHRKVSVLSTERPKEIFWLKDRNKGGTSSVDMV